MRIFSVFLILSFIFGISTSLHAEDLTQATDPYSLRSLVLITLAVLLFYFILWRSEKKRRQAAEKVRANLKRGDKVVAVGIIGTVAEVRSETVVLEMVDGAKIEVLTAAITDSYPDKIPATKED
jgi:preprotein translocase subunit YajC